MRKSNCFLVYLALNLLLGCFLVIHSSWRTKAEMGRLAEKAKLVRELELTDLCLFTEASYTRHLSQSDLHTPFQDFPMSFEHFPSGSMTTPPPQTRKINAKLD